MRESKDYCTMCASPPLTAETIISDFLFEADMAFLEENLHELFIEFVASEVGCDRSDKDDIVYTYQILRKLIRNIQLLKLNQD